MKLVKLLANLGYGSRKEVMGLIRGGAVTDTSGRVLRDRHLERLLECGADEVIPDTVESSMMLAKHTLTALGEDQQLVRQAVPREAAHRGEERDQ